jgi:hypothetical protein
MDNIESLSEGMQCAKKIPPQNKLAVFFWSIRDAVNVEALIGIVSRQSGIVDRDKKNSERPVSTAPSPRLVSANRRR